MLRKIIRLPHTLLHFAFLAIRSSYSFQEKLQVFYVLTSLWIRIIFSRKQQQAHRQKIFGYTVHTCSYSLLFDLFKEIFLLRVYDFTSTCTHPVIIDCGANIGLSVLYFKKRYPHASIMAFEPNPATFALLQSNIHENKVEGVTLYPIALSNREGRQPFYVDHTVGGLNASLIQRSHEQQTVTVEVNKLSAYLPAQHPIALIKMDVEGAEADILLDLSEKKVLQQAEQYLIEYHHQTAEGSRQFSAFLKLLEEQGYHYHIQNIFPKKENRQSILLHCYRNTE